MLHFLDPAVHYAYLVVNGLATILQPIGGSASAVIATIVCTLAVKLCLLPLSVSTARAERARAALAPRIAALRARHGKDPARLAAEVSRLHQRERVRPLAGCLPQLLQAPVLSVVYRLFLLDTIAGQPNQLLAATLFGAPLGSPWPSVMGAFGLISGPGLAAAAVVVLLIGVAALATRQARSRDTVEGPAATIGRLLPYGTVLFATFVPLATAVYLLTASAWTLGERAALTQLLA